MLSEMASDGSMLGKVNEDEDDDDSTGSLPGSQPETVEERLERLTRENTILKQREQQHMYQNSRIMRPRASSSAAYALGNGYLQEPVPEESDYAIDELDESHDPADLAARRGLPRRMSEYGAGPFRSPYPVENRKLDSVKKAIWQSSLGFGGLGDISQSRRHSFADVPQRQGSIASIADSVGPHDQGAQDAQHSQEFPSPYSENPNFPTAHQGKKSAINTLPSSDLELTTQPQSRPFSQVPASQAHSSSRLWPSRRTVAAASSHRPMLRFTRRMPTGRPRLTATCTA